MSDYIKREDAAHKIAYANAHDLCAEYGQHFSWDKVDYESEMENALKFLADIPSADVAPVRHGGWIEYGENKDGTHNICCSVCDGFFKSKGHANSCYTRNKYRYCHNCGARMDGEIDE